MGWSRGWVSDRLAAQNKSLGGHCAQRDADTGFHFLGSYVHFSAGIFDESQNF
jgi:hypothetical protein